VLIWINGPFGVGKTALSTALSSITGYPIFDPEDLGFLMRETIPQSPYDFQDLPAWRRLVPSFATELVRSGATPLIVVQSVLNAKYWDEMECALEKSGISMIRVLLHADRDLLIDRIEADTIELGARRWRLDNLDAYEAAHGWLSLKSDLTIAERDATPGSAASRIARFMAEAETAK